VKNKTITAFVLAYVLLGSIYSVIPTFADNHFTIIESILDESSSRIEEKFAEFELSGLEIPQDADSLYNEGLAEYQKALDLLDLGDFENAKEHGLEALSLFEDAYEAIFEAEEELAEEQEEYTEDLFEIEESITDLEIEAAEIRNLISINALDFSLDDYDSTILLATESYINGDLKESEKYIESAEDILDDILDQIEYKAEEEKDERVNAFVEKLLKDLEDVIFKAIESGVSQSIIDELKNIVKELETYEDLSDIFEMTDESSHLEDIFESSDDLRPDHEEELEGTFGSFMDGSFTLVLSPSTTVTIFTNPATDFDIDFDDFDELDELIMGFPLEVKVVLSNGSLVATEIELENEVEHTLDAIEDAQEEIDEALEEINDEGGVQAAATAKRNLAITTLGQAQTALVSLFFEDAEDLAEEAEDLAHEAKDLVVDSDTSDSGISGDEDDDAKDGDDDAKDGDDDEESTTTSTGDEDDDAKDGDDDEKSTTTSTGDEDDDDEDDDDEDDDSDN